MNTTLPKVLIIAFHYPPVRGSSGVQRTLKFSAYLRELGWEPMVLTVSPRAYQQVGDDQMAEIPQRMIIERAFALDSSRHLAIRGRYPGIIAQPDRWVTWWPAAVWRGMQMIRKHRPAVILSTYPIATAHLIGLTLRRLAGLPWVADCRDSMTEPGYPADAMTWHTNRRLEAAMVRNCQKAVFTTRGTLGMYSDRYPEAGASKWAVIENGFDEENFSDAEHGLLPQEPSPGGRVTLLHSGILYQRERDPTQFFSALRALKNTGVISSSSLHVLLRASGNDAEYRPMLAQFGIDDIVELAPSVSYRLALQEMMSVDGLLLFQSRLCNHQVPAKLYEYYRAGRPIFALTDHEGDTAFALRSAGVTSIVDIADENQIAAGLTSFIAGLKRQELSGIPRSLAAEHSRRARTAQLADLLRQVAQPP